VNYVGGIEVRLSGSDILRAEEFVLERTGDGQVSVDDLVNAAQAAMIGIPALRAAILELLDGRLSPAQDELTVAG
jgi:hypothetical protein